MVDLRTNDKLRDRARRIVAQAGGQVKVAVLMLRCGLPAAAAAALLEAAGGSLRRALDRCDHPS